MKKKYHYHALHPVDLLILDEVIYIGSYDMSHDLLFFK